ncbi:hypothetical protein HDV03_004371 [Kappamyces sp. JEL0829]|nr:hypothetical protein HDV03_004371 [Kappamyces sp. JEL0829]
MSFHELKSSKINEIVSLLLADFVTDLTQLSTKTLKSAHLEVAQDPDSPPKALSRPNPLDDLLLSISQIRTNLESTAKKDRSTSRLAELLKTSQSTATQPTAQKGGLALSAAPPKAVPALAGSSILAQPKPSLAASSFPSLQKTFVFPSLKKAFDLKSLEKADKKDSVEGAVSTDDKRKDSAPEQIELAPAKNQFNSETGPPEPASRSSAGRNAEAAKETAAPAFVREDSLNPAVTIDRSTADTAGMLPQPALPASKPKDSGLDISSGSFASQSQESNIPSTRLPVASQSASALPQGGDAALHKPTLPPNALPPASPDQLVESTRLDQLGAMTSDRDDISMELDTPPEPLATDDESDDLLLSANPSQSTSTAPSNQANTAASIDANRIPDNIYKGSATSFLPPPSATTAAKQVWLLG